MTLKNAQELGKLITAIGKLGKKTDAMIHEAAVHAVGYSVEHNDIRFANQLLSNLPEGARRAAFVAYMENYGQLAYMTTEKQFKFFAVKDIKFDAFALLEGKKWHEFKKENVTSMYDVAKLVDALIRKIEKGIEKGMTIEHAALLDDIKIASAQYHGADVVTDDTSADEDISDEELLAYVIK